MTDKLFTARIPKETLDGIFTAFFRNMGFINSTVSLHFDSIVFEDDLVELSAEREEETVQ